jgi:stage V sporulation protein SpoVS
VGLVLHGRVPIKAVGSGNQLQAAKRVGQGRTFCAMSPM